MRANDKVIIREDVFSLARSVFRKLVHFFSYHFILKRNWSTVTRVAGLDLTVLPTVFHPKIFLTSGFFASFLQSLDLRGKTVIEVGTGSEFLLFRQRWQVRFQCWLLM